VAIDSASEYVPAVRWSPDGAALVYSVTNWTKPVPEQTVARIIGLGGSVLAEFPGINEPAFSPDGTRISGLRMVTDGRTSATFAQPVVIDIATRAEVAIAPYSSYAAPIWSPDSQSLAVICVTVRYQTSLPDGGTTEVVQDCGGDGLRIVPATGGEPRVLLPFDNADAFYTSPSWSPDGATIAIYGQGLGAPCAGYALIDVASGGLRDCLALPDGGSLGFGCGGWGGAGASDWTPDGTAFVYHWQSQQGETGLAVVDLATGTRAMIPSQGVYGLDASPDGAHVVFGSWPSIWVADTDGSDLALLADGNLPVWQPAP
jgi:Tol biopolymer transport system component